MYYGFDHIHYILLTVLSYGSPEVQGIGVVYPENVPTQVFMIEFSPSVRNLTFSVESG